MPATVSELVVVEACHALTKTSDKHTSKKSEPNEYPDGPNTSDQYHHTGAIQPARQHTKGNGRPTNRPQSPNTDPEGNEHHHQDQPHNGGQPQNGHNPGSDSEAPVYTHDHKTVTAMPGGAVVFGSKTVQPGHEVTIGAGWSKTTVALQTKGGNTRLLVDGSTYDHAPQHVVTQAAFAASEPHESAVVITTNGRTITAIREGRSIILVDGTSTATVRDGSHVTFEGQTVSVPDRGASVAVNGKILPLTAAGGSQAVVTAEGHIFTAVDVGRSIMLKDVSSTALVKDGRQTQFEGQTISVGPQGTAIVVDGKTITLSEVKKTTSSTSRTTTGIGDYVHHGLGGATRSSSPATAPDTGAAPRSIDAGMAVKIFSAAVLGCISALIFL